MSRKKYIDKKQVVPIDFFVRNYIGQDYVLDGPLTHKNMCIYLEDRYGIILQKICFANAKIDKVLTGEYVVVEDECHQSKIYKNPMMSLNTLNKELNSKETSEQVKKNRTRILNELGLIETNMGILEKEVEDEYQILKLNRQKVKSKKHY